MREMVKKRGLQMLLLFAGVFFFCKDLFAVPIHYGDTIRIKHFFVDARLHSHKLNYFHKGTSGQQQVTGYKGKDDNDLWIVKDADGTPKGSRFGQIVTTGATIRLEHVKTQKNLHHHGENSSILSPNELGREVTCYVEKTPGEGNYGDNWILQLMKDVAQPYPANTEWDSSMRFNLFGTNLSSDKSIATVTGKDYLWLPGAAHKFDVRKGILIKKQLIVARKFDQESHWIVQDVKASPVALVQKAVEDAAKIAASVAAPTVAEWQKSGMDTPALRIMTPGLIIGLYVPQLQKYLRVEDTKFLKATGASEDEASTHFIVMRNGNWLGLKSITAGENNLQSVPKTKEVRFENKNFADASHTWEHWSFVPDDPKSVHAVRLWNRATGGWLSVTADAHANTTITDKDKATVFEVEVIATLPLDFENEAGLTDEEIAVGSRNGKLEAYIISPDLTKILRYNTDSLADNPWQTFASKDDNGADIKPLTSISMSSDGDLWILAGDKSDAYRYNWEKKYFVLMPRGVDNEKLILDKISVGNKDSVWAVDFDTKRVYQHTKDGWVARCAEGVATDIAAGLNVTMILNEKGLPHKYIGENKWEERGAVELMSLSIGNRKHVMGIGKDGFVYKRVLPARDKTKKAEAKGAKAPAPKDKEEAKKRWSTWEQLKDKEGKPVAGYKGVYINAGGCAFLHKLDGEIAHNKEAGFVVTAKKAPGKVGEPAKVTGKKKAVTTKRAAAKKTGKVSKKAIKKAKKKSKIAKKKGVAAKKKAKKAKKAAKKKTAKKAKKAKKVVKKKTAKKAKKAKKVVKKKTAKKAKKAKKAAKKKVAKKQQLPNKM